MSDPTPPDLSQQNLGYQRAAEFLVHYIRKDTTAWQRAAQRVRELERRAGAVHLRAR